MQPVIFGQQTHIGPYCQSVIVIKRYYIVSIWPATHCYGLKKYVSLRKC